MNDLIADARRRLIDAADTVCLDRARLATEAWRQFESDPPVLRRAKTFAFLLEHMTLDVLSNPVFAGNTSSAPRAWMLLPEYGFGVPDQAEIEHEHLRGFLDGEAVPDDLRTFWAGKSFGGSAGVGHLAVDYSRVVTHGLEAVIAEAESPTDDHDPGRREFRTAVAIGCRAVIAWAGRYADAAADAARRAACPDTRRALGRVAEACRHVPAKGARDLFEALQAMVLAHLAIHIEGHGYSVSIGLPDRLLEPYARDDGETVDLLSAFLLKIAANSLWGSFSKTQAITVGGLDAEGNDRCNALTRAFLDACGQVRVGDPHLFLRWHERCARDTKDAALALLATGTSMPMLIGDAQTVAGLIDAGIAPADAWDYCVVGCNELGIPGRMARSASGPGYSPLTLLNDVLLSDGPAPADMDELLGRLEGRMVEHLQRLIPNGEKHWRRMAERVPTPFTSALMQGCLAHGRDLHDWMPYNFPGLYTRGLTNAVNALAAIDHAVFETSQVTWVDLIGALRGDFPDEAVRRRLLAAPKWGNDDPRADRWADRLLGMRERALRKAQEATGIDGHLVCHVVRSLHHLDGIATGATADGRKAGQPVADSVGAQAGTASNGPTATLASVLKLHAARHFRGGTNLNLTFSRATLADPATRGKVADMAEAFFAGGGQELQIGCIDARTLRDAQAHPDRHADLLVRVAGFNARFIDLSRTHQEELIRRAAGAY